MPMTPDHRRISQEMDKILATVRSPGSRVRVRIERHRATCSDPYCDGCLPDGSFRGLDIPIPPAIRNP
jgi:hypothetical protein